MLCAQGHQPNNSIYLDVIQPRTNMRTTAPTDLSRKYSNSSIFNITVLISGSGTNLQALIDACKGGRSLPNAHVSHVISNRRDAYGLKRADEAGIPTTYHNLVQFKKAEPDTDAGVAAARRKYDSKLAQIILSHIPSPDLVVCAGWMHVLSDPFVNALKAANVPIINLHPALPGQFSGSNAIGRAWEAFQRGDIAVTGVMIHHVINEVDMGKPIVVKEVECKPGESESDLAERIHAVEWKAIVEGTSIMLKDLEGRRRHES
jgi:phosphoribosylglycinamide formyltransferase